MNRTWNWYTIGTGGVCDNYSYAYGTNDAGILNNEGPLSNDLMTFMNIGSDNNDIMIPDMGTDKRYRIQYYDPASLSVINTVNKDSDLIGNLELKAYPLLTQSRPIVFFKAWRNPIFGDEESFFPTHNSTINQFIERDPMADIPFEDAHHEIVNPYLSTTSANTLSEIQIYPSFRDAYNNKLHVIANNFSGQLLEVLDIHGKTLITSKISDSTTILDVSQLSAGCYALRISQSISLMFIKTQK